MLRFVGGAHTAPLLRTIERLRYDIVTIGRAVSESLPPDIEARLAAPMAVVRAALADYLRACGNAVLQRRRSAPLDPVQSALHSYAEAVAAVRRKGLTLNLSEDAAERFFAFGFALEQMHQDIQDLVRCTIEWASTMKTTTPINAGSA
jgi:hypothetical protein